MVTGNIFRKCAAMAAFLLPIASYAQTDALKLRIDGNSYYDETIVRFVSGATDGFDGNYDAWKWFSPNSQVPSIYTRIDSISPLSINALPALDHKWTVGIFVNINVAGNYTITPTEVAPFLPGVCIMLEDVSTGNYYDMRSGQTPSFMLPAGNNNNQARFRLHVITPVLLTVSGTSCYNSADGQLVISKAGCHSWSYTLSDYAGNLVSAVTGVNETDTVSGLAGGTYTITSSTPAGCTETGAVSITQPASMNPSFACDTMKTLSQAMIQFNGNAINAVSVAWDFDDGSPASTAISPTHIYTNTGTYNVSFTAFNGSCSETVTRLVTIVPDPVVTSVGSSNAAAAAIYAAGSTLVVEGMKGDMRLSVYNMLGQQVVQDALKKAGTKVSVKLNIPSGYYLVSLKGNDSEVFSKVFITAE